MPVEGGPRCRCQADCGKLRVVVRVHSGKQWFDRNRLITNRRLVLVLTCVLGAFVVVHAREAPEKAARKVADSWITQWDSGNWLETYKALAESTRKVVSKADWLDYWSTVRKPLGNLKTRQFATAKYIESLPSLRGQDGAMIQYKSSFDSGGSVVETVGMVREKDGTWRVANYLANKAE
jgi:hypothetical protein